jgi:hypothetical protein
MYIVPQSKLAPEAETIPIVRRWVSEDRPCSVLKLSRMAARTIHTAPTTTLAMVAGRAPFSSPNSSLAHRRPISAFVFHRGKAIERPTSRMAKMVSVLATAHNDPARTAQMTRCFF